MQQNSITIQDMQKHTAKCDTGQSNHRRIKKWMWEEQQHEKMMRLQEAS